MAAGSRKPSSHPVPVPVPVTTTPPAASSSLSNPGPSSSAAGVLKQRRQGSTASKREGAVAVAVAVAGGGVVQKTSANHGDDMPWTARNKWIVYAVASGACAAFNGVFAKLTTDGLTRHIAHGISGFFGFESIDGILEVTVRCAFFGLNILFNIIMWTLFTQALAKGNSTTQVSIMNTSTNFMISALLGLAIFAEALPPLWWVGATLLVAGNVILGRKDGSPDDPDADAGAEQSEAAEAAERGHGSLSLPDVKEEDEDVPLLGDLDSPPHNI
ncbi:hypothetical protein F5Y12DRAFT_624624 [Xylaria sp. FL1777]|nr:hypothetical protein F5Y12DRAFT_624624 [Xylaria sp. FL1777]